MADLERLTADDFARHRHEPFALSPGGGPPLELELVEVTGAGRPFSLVFRGGPTPPLAQGIHALEHERLGRLEIFLVPLGPDSVGQRYEAVFT